MSYAAEQLPCVYGFGYDDLRVRRRGAWCVLEVRRTTEQGTSPARAIGRVRCAGAVETWSEDVPRALPRSSATPRALVAGDLGSVLNCAGRRAPRVGARDGDAASRAVNL